MKFEDEATQKLPDMSNLALPEPRWWKTAGVILLGLISLAVAGAGLAGLHGCGGEIGPEGTPMRDDLPVAPLFEKDAPLPDGIESTSSALSNGAFGNSGFGSNFYCPLGGWGCYCDPAPGTGKDGKRSDCGDLGRSGRCEAGGTLECGPDVNRAICQCKQRGSVAAKPSPSSVLLATGYWATDCNTAFYRLPHSDRSCWTPYAGVVARGITPGVPAGGELDGTYSFQRCTPEEEGGMVMQPGVYQTPDTQLHLKRGRRSCRLTSDEWGRRGTWAAGTAVTPIQVSYATANTFDSWLGCLEMELGLD